MKNKQKHIAFDLAKRLQVIDYDKLPISEYNKRYIRNLKPALGYYMKIYTDCLCKGIEATGLKLSNITFIDYGGGSGFLSMLAKEIGIGKVIYIDLNPLSVETVRLLKQETGIGPDIILQGDSGSLAKWCNENSVTPELLIATDLIEHVYNLDSFFSDLIGINNSIYMIFTTASTPFNPYVKRKLRKAMKGCESGTLISPNYYSMRYQYIRKNYPSLSENEISKWSFHTRGLIYSDIEKAINEGKYPTCKDHYNTCDPSTGNWIERILSIADYQSLLVKYHYKIKVEKGFYNTDRGNPVLSFICSCINSLIRSTGAFGFILAPFIILSCSKNRMNT